MCMNFIRDGHGHIGQGVSRYCEIIARGGVKVFIVSGELLKPASSSLICGPSGINLFNRGFRAKPITHWSTLDCMHGMGGSASERMSQLLHLISAQLPNICL